MAHDTEKLRELLERCEKASGPDREIECRLFASLQYGSSYEEMVGIVPNLMQWACPAYTASLDASIALVERMLPGRGWSVESYGLTCLGEIICDDEVDASSVGPTPPLAILSTLLRALISQAEGEAQHG